jgi:ATP-dependent helicase/nuclease subunit A
MIQRIHPVPEQTRALQAAAADPGKSVWVSANAGSGKTHVLSRRVIRLLLGGADPARILCLTYTRTAAANMAIKVFGDLAQWAMMPDEALSAEIGALDGRAPGADRLRQARRLFARALETPGGLKIQTIHAFCEAVLHRFPLEANIAGHFELIDPQTEAALIAEARRALLAAATGGEDPRLAEAFTTVFSAAGESGFDELLGEIVAKRGHLARILQRLEADGGAGPALRRQLGLGPDETAEGIAAALLPDAYFTAERAEALARRADAAGKAAAKKFADALGHALGLVSAGERLDALSAAFLTALNGDPAPRSASPIASKGVAEHFPGLEQEFTRFSEALLSARDRIATLKMADATVAAMTLASRLIEGYERLKSARGYLDFNDLILRTAGLLSRPDVGAWIQYKLDRGLDHILIDEAQDTSPEQWRVIRKLAEEFFAGAGARDGIERTIFAVGDEKQSIYSFQGAEPAAFAETGIEFRERVRAARRVFERVELRHSFRSVGDVLSAVDRVFATPSARQGLTLYPEEIYHPAIRATDPGHVEVWPALAPEAAEAPEDWTQAVDHASAPAVRLAEAVADRIALWMANGEIIEGKGRRLRPGDVMVLVRKRDSFVHALSRSLKKKAIAVAGADRLRLGDHIAVKDLTAIGRFVLQPDDDLSLAALLRSPVFDLTDEALMTLAHGRGRRSLWQSLLRAATRDHGLKAAARTLARWRGEAGYRSVFEFYSTVLGRDGVRAALLARLGAETSDVLDEFVNFILACERTAPLGLGAFLEILNRASPEIKREIAQTRDEVRIMTVHAAKGLEAPVVFLVDNGSRPIAPRHLPRLLPWGTDAEGAAPGLFLWRAGKAVRNRLSAALEQQIRLKAEEEYRRLLYVGMTRAEDRLIVCGYFGPSGQPEQCWHRMVADALAPVAELTPAGADHLAGDILRYAVTPARVRTAPAETAAPPEAGPPDFPTLLRSPLPPEETLPPPLHPSAPGVAIEDERGTVTGTRSPVLGPPGGKARTAARGAAIHRLLQYLPEIVPERREATALAYLGRYGAGWSESERREAWRSVAAILADRRFADVFAHGSRPEVAVAGTLILRGKPRPVSGRIDRLSVSAREVQFVDFKTGRLQPGSDAAIPAGHVAQLALYRALLRILYPERRIVAGLLYTEAPRLFEIADRMMDDALERLAAT